MTVGNDIIVIINSGKTAADRKRLSQVIQDSFQNVGFIAQIIILAQYQDYISICERLMRVACEQNIAVVAVGGDGTVNLLAGLCSKHGVKLGIIPQGTFNYFARNHHIPLTINEAVKVIAAGHVRKATLGYVNDQVFINKVSMGLWSKLIRQREEATSHFGRLRIVGVLSAIYSLLQPHTLLPIHIESEGKKTYLDTSMVFICNNKLQLENIGLQGAECIDAGQLAIIALRKATRFQMIRFLIKGILKTLADEERVSEFCSASFKLTAHTNSIDIVIDGDIARAQTPLVFTSKIDALNLIVPG